MAARRSLLKKTLIVTLATLVIVAGLLVGGVRLIDTLAPQYRHALADRIGQRIGGEVTIGAIELRWRWNGPLLELQNVAIVRKGNRQPAVRLDSVGLHFAFNDLVHGQRLPDGLVLHAPKLAARVNAAGRVELRHWSRPNDPPLDWSQLQRVRGLLDFVRIENARLTINAARLPGGKAKIESLNAAFENSDDGRLAISASAQGPDWFRQLSIAGQFTGALAEGGNAQFQAHASGIDTLALARSGGLLPGNLAQRLSGGRVAAQVNGHWRDQHLAQATIGMQSDALADGKRSGPLIPALSATISATGAAGKPIAFKLDTIDGDIEGLDRFALSGQVDRGEPGLRISARHLPDTLTQRLARLRFAQLNDTDIRADIDNVSLAVGADTPLRLGADFTDLKVKTPQLAFGPIDGRYEQQAGTHRLQFRRAGGALTARHYIRGALPIDDLGGELTWQRTANGLRLDAHDLRIVAAGTTLTTNGDVQMPDAAAPVVDIRADLKSPDVTPLLAHIPQAPDLPNPHLRDWLPKAIKAGRLEHGHLQITGSMDRFPFAQPRAGERFHLTLEGRGADIVYKPGWPALENARGTLTLDGDDLRVDIDKTDILGVAIDKATGHVANVREPVLHVDGQVKNGPADRMLSFLARSPLRDRFGKLVDVLDIAGPADLALDLRVPLKPGLGKPEVNGRVDAHGDSLNHHALPAPITGVNGQLTFDDNGLRADNLAGNLLGVNLKVALKPGAGKAQHIVARAAPTLPDDRKALAGFMPARWLDYARGQAKLKIDLQVERNGKVSRIGVDSDLAGLALDLPAPLTKSADSRAPLSLQVDPEQHGLTLDYDNRLNIAARLTDGHPSRVQIHLNDSALQAPDTDGLWIGGHARAIDVPGWYRVIQHVRHNDDKNSDSAGKDNGGLAFTGGNLTADEWRLGERYFENAQVRAQPMHGTHGFRINLDGPDTQGQVTWTRNPGERQTVAGNLKRVALKTRPIDAPPADEHDHSPVIWPDVSPLALPALKLFVAHFSVDDTSFGATRVQASALADGWQLDSASMNNGALSADASARWTRRDGLTRARAQTRIKGQGLTQLIAALGYPSPVQAAKARIESKLTIGANPNGLDLRKLNGHLELALDNGKLVSVESGAARLLGLFNLYVLPRRLTLDFRDVVDKGLAFDKVRANFDITDGNAYGKRVRIETPSSTIRIAGRIGLAARDYDERVTIVPKVGSGVTLASTLVGGPIVGAAVFAVQQLLKRPIQDASSISYSLKGSWDNPEIADPNAEK